MDWEKEIFKESNEPMRMMHIRLDLFLKVKNEVNPDAEVDVTEKGELLLDGKVIGYRLPYPGWYAVEVNNE